MDRIHLTSLDFFFFLFLFTGCVQAAKDIDYFSVSYASPRILCLRKKDLQDCFQGTNYDAQQFCIGFLRRMWSVYVIPGHLPISHANHKMCTGKQQNMFLTITFRDNNCWTKWPSDSQPSSYVNLNNNTVFKLMGSNAKVEHYMKQKHKLC